MIMTDEQKPVLNLDFSQPGKIEDIKFSRESPVPYIPVYETVDDYSTERAQEIVDATMELTLRPQQNDSQKVVAAVLRAAADRLCTDLGELECPIDKLREIADEVEAL